MMNNKVAVITGGSRGIGRATCIKLAESGANIAFIHFNDEERADEVVQTISSYNVKVKGYSCDVSSFEETKKTFNEIISDFGTVDILVNNAGIVRDKLLLGMSELDFDKVIDVNLKGVFNTIKQVYPVFAKKKSGKIINISSVSGIMGNAGQANYSASKAGLIGLTKTVAKELAARGVCCNAIAPGFIKTDMTESFSNNEALINGIPMKRMGNPDEVAELIRFLASDASNYITGEVIRIDGGLAM